MTHDRAHPCAQWAEEDATAKEDVIAAQRRKHWDEAQREWKEWSSVKKKARIKLPVDLVIARRMVSDSSIPFMYSGNGTTTGRHNNQYMLAGNRVSVPYTSSAMFAIVQGTLNLADVECS